MTIGEILGISGGGIIVLLTLIQIVPVKLNPWSALAKWWGKHANEEIHKRLEAVEEKVDTLKNQIDQAEAVTARTRILRFNDELLCKKRHTKEAFDDILLEIDAYEEYCEGHEHFVNSITVESIKNIRHTYEKCMDEHDFDDEFQKLC